MKFAIQRLLNIQWKPLNRDTFFGKSSYLTIEITSDDRDNRLYGTNPDSRGVPIKRLPLYMSNTAEPV